MAGCMGSAFGISDRDRLLPIVPMFHASGWGMPYQGWLAGADLLMPDRFLQAEPLATFIEQEKPDLLRCRPDGVQRPAALRRRAQDRRLQPAAGRLRRRGGAAVADAEVARAARHHGHPGLGDDRDLAARRHRAPAGGRRRSTTGAGGPRPAASSRRSSAASVGDDGTVLPNDGQSVGRVRGPRTLGHRLVLPGRRPVEVLRRRLAAHRRRRLPRRQGFMQISDRSKDVIKSGGEWISSVDLENALMGHPDVVEAAWSRCRTSGGPSGRSRRSWSAGRDVDADELREFLGIGGQVAAARAVGLHRRCRRPRSASSTRRSRCTRATRERSAVEADRDGRQCPAQLTEVAVVRRERPAIATKRRGADRPAGQRRQLVAGAATESDVRHGGMRCRAGSGRCGPAAG